MNIRSFNYNFLDILQNIESEKIGFYFSFCLHLLFLLFVFGFPNFFKSAPIDIPTVIPIEIINVSEVTSIPKEIEKKNVKAENQKVSKKAEVITKEKKFNNVDFQKTNKFDAKTKPIKELDKPDKIIEKITKEDVKIVPKVEIDKKVSNEDKFESLPTKKIKPKIKPKTKNDIEKSNLDVDIKVKSKPKPNFDIASMLKDLRNDQSMINKFEKDKLKDKSSENKKVTNTDAILSISEIDLLIQQLSSCWSAPAGAVIKKGMVVKISAQIKPDRKVLYESVRIIDTNIRQSNPFYGPITESAMRTLLNPECNPLRLPEDKYNLWKNLTIIFDHSIMKGYQ